MILRKRWQDMLVLVLGVWLFFSPFLLGYSNITPAAMNAYLCGIAVAVLAVIAMSDTRMWEEWTNLALGAWLILAPFVLGFSEHGTATWNHVIIGLLIGVDALAVVMRRSPPHHPQVPVR
jgi:hypothetical protein